jgi:hypothetical protein
MRIVRDASEDEMVAVFVQGEIQSERFAEAIEAILDVRGIPRRVIEEPDLHDAEENELPREILGEFRSFRRNDDVFSGFPADDIRWVRAGLAAEEVLAIRYIDWGLLARGQRRFAAAGRRARNDRRQPDVCTDRRAAAGKRPTPPAADPGRPGRRQRARRDRRPRAADGVHDGARGSSRRPRGPRRSLGPDRRLGSLLGSRRGVRP